ncbi:hypothetical protein RUND412_001794 [Rhizina undulata]
MPYPFTLPTTSTLAFNTYYHSPVYSSLPLLTTTYHNSLRNALKHHKRQPASAQNANLPAILKELESYIPHLQTLSESIKSGDVLPKDEAPALESEWRSILTETRFGTEPPRVRRSGIEYEMFWTVSTLAYAYTLYGRSQMLEVLGPGGKDKSVESKQLLLNQAAGNLLQSAEIFSFIARNEPPPTPVSWPVELSLPVVSALKEMSLADATLLAVLKQDPYPSYLSLTVQLDGKLKEKGRSTGKEWLYNPPEPPTGVRALLFARLCIAAADHAAKALGLLSTSSSSRRKILGAGSKGDGGLEEVSGDLLKYLDSLQKVATAKCCRFLAIDAEASGRVGEGISWIRLARESLGVEAAPSTPSDAPKNKLKQFRQQREEKDFDSSKWGIDAGKNEETRVLEALEAKWRKLNDSVMFQSLLAPGELKGKIPTGRQFHELKGWEPRGLSGEELRALRERRMDVEEELEALGLAEESEEEGRENVGYARQGGYY